MARILEPDPVASPFEPEGPRDVSVERPRVLAVPGALIDVPVVVGVHQKRAIDRAPALMIGWHSNTVGVRDDLPRPGAAERVERLLLFERAKPRAYEHRMPEAVKRAEQACHSVAKDRIDPFEPVQMRVLKRLG